MSLCMLVFDMMRELKLEQHIRERSIEFMMLSPGLPNFRISLLEHIYNGSIE